MSELSFPKSGYHREFSTTNCTSIFEFVNRDEMYTVNFPDEVSSTARVMIGEVIDAWLVEEGKYSDETKFPYNAFEPPFGWAGVIPKKTDDIPFQGSFVKRVMSYYHKTFEINIPNKVASTIGNLAGKDVSGHAFHFKFDPIANYRAGEFGDEGSCYWTDRQGARVLIRNEGGSFVTFFSDESGFINRYGEVENGMGLGRAWILPIDQWTPFRGSPLFLLCNVYVNKEINKYNATRAISTLLGMTYRYCSQVDSNLDVLYINGDVGFVIGENLDQVKEVSETGLFLKYSTEYQSVSVDYELSYGKNDEHEDEAYCERCGEYVSVDDWIDDLSLCYSCAMESHTQCARCGGWASNDDAIYTPFNSYCPDCAERLDIRYCDCCDEYKRDTYYREDVDEDVCDDCWIEYYDECRECGHYFNIDDLIDRTCEKCAKIKEEEKQNEQNQDRLQ